MRHPLFYPGLWAGKLALFALRLLRRPCSDIPGRIPTHLYSGFLKDMPKPARLIVVTGTNGKSTTTALLAQALTALGHRVLTNSTGFNGPAGIAVTLLQEANWLGRLKADTAVLELDELSCSDTLPALAPSHVLCTNLTRDSLRRNGHPGYVAFRIDEGIRPDMTLVLNGDDMITAGLGSDRNQKVFFAVGELPTDDREPHGAAIDLQVCPQCGTTLDWDYWRYNHIGRVHCSKCGFASPKADFTVSDITARSITVTTAATTVDVPLLNDNIANVYNSVSVVAMLAALGVPLPKIPALFETLRIPGNIWSEERVGDVKVIRQLTKGMVGVACSRVFAYLNSIPGDKALVMNIGEWEEVRDECENTAWMYDADYELLRDPSIKRIVVGGVRRFDQAARLAIAGVDPTLLDTTPDEIDAAKVVDLDGIDCVINMYADHNRSVTGNAVQSILVERLRQRLLAPTLQGEGVRSC
jgi:Zn ribbon nucleic-acid-binding protein